MARVDRTDGDYVGVRSRLLHIDARIRKRDYPNQTTLSKLCGVSSKTIQRDLDYLKYNMCAPLEYDASRKGYFYSQEGFFLPLVFASGAEFQAIKVIGEALSQYEGTPLGQLMDSAFKRIVGLFKAEDVAGLRELAERICFAGLPSSAISQEVWDALLTGLQRDQRLELTYLKGGAGPAAIRKFEPYGLIVRNRDWFVHGFCHKHGGRVNLFVPYIKQARLLDEFFERPKGFSLREYARSGFQGLQSEGKKASRVVLRCAPEAAGAVECYRFASNQAVKREASGHVVVTFMASALFQVEREVLSWGGKIEVVQPASLRMAVRDAALQLAKGHT